MFTLSQIIGHINVINDCIYSNLKGMINKTISSSISKRLIIQFHHKYLQKALIDIHS